MIRKRTNIITGIKYVIHTFSNFIIHRKRIKQHGNVPRRKKTFFCISYRRCLQETTKTSAKQPSKSIHTTSSTQPTTTHSASLGGSNEVVSSGVTFIRCKGCRGWGKDLLLPSGFCEYCSQKQGKTQARQSAPVHSYQLPQSQTSPSVVASRASEILGMQPKLRMYKKRPGTIYFLSLSYFVESNIPLSRREKQSWETGRVDPLSLGDSNDGPKFRKRYRD